MTRPRIHVHANSPRLREAGRLLISVLGRPQLNFVDDCSEATDGPLIMLDAADADRQEHSGTHPCFRVASGPISVNSIECELTEGIQFRFAEQLESIQEDNGYLAERTLTSRARAMLAIAWRRFRKSSAPIPTNDIFESNLCSLLYRRIFGESVQAEFKAWLCVDEQAAILQYSSFGGRSDESDLSHLDELIRECYEEDAANRHFRDLALLVSSDGSPTDADLTKIMSRPQVLAHASLILAESGASDNQKLLGDRLKAWIENCRNAKQLCAIGFAAMAMNQTGLLEKTIEIMNGPGWQIDDSTLLPLVPGKRNIERSLLASGLIAALAIRMEGAEFSSLVPALNTVRLNWSGFDLQAINGSTVGTNLCFLDLKERKISSSLLDNWLTLIEQPEISEGQLCISDSRYNQTVMAIEMIWGRIIDAIAAEAGQPIVRTRPWPAGSEFALSVRYDVDRPVPEGNIKRILDIQADTAGGMCGSWFFIEGMDHNEQVRESLKEHGQEEGLHSTRLSEEPCQGLGVTAHSSQYSQYFRGRASLMEADNAQSLYTEQMTHIGTAPRRAWLGDRASSTWAFPLHFPIEGSVADQDLSYFNRHAETCVRQKELSAHVVLGAHPDCQPELVRMAIEQCGLSGGWAAPMKDVLTRIRSLHTPGNIVIDVQDDQFTAWSREDVKDVVFEITPLHGEPILFQADLKANQHVVLQNA